MFTGLIEEIGVIVSATDHGDGFDLVTRAQKVVAGLQLGDSVSINGVCLTVTAVDQHTFTVGLAPETRKRTNLETLHEGAPVNLERALLPTTRMGGHYVQGHVDGTGEVIEFRPDADALWLKVSCPEDLMKYIVPKGYIAIDGASLTVVNTGPNWFDVTLIAYSQEKLILPGKKIGDRVNLEVDILAKYVEKITSFSNSPRSLNEGARP